MTASEVAALQETAVPANTKKNTREMSNLLWRGLDIDLLMVSGHINVLVQSSQSRCQRC